MLVIVTGNGNAFTELLNGQSNRIGEKRRDTTHSITLTEDCAEDDVDDDVDGADADVVIQNNIVRRRYKQRARKRVILLVTTIVYKIRVPVYYAIYTVSYVFTAHIYIIQNSKIH